MSYTITLVPGDGIGPEVMAAAVRVLSATGIGFHWETEIAGASAIGEHGTALPPRVLASILKNKVALKGPTETPVGTGHRSVNVELRKQLDLYANLRPVKTLPGVKSRYEGVDLIVVRENTEDLYSGLEHVVVPGVVESIKIITEKASTRIARFAFEHARSHRRKRVSAVHKANIGEAAAVFEAVHGSAPDIAGRNLANPMALILSSALMLEYLGEHDPARRVREAVYAVLAEGRKLTRDLGGTAGTTEIAEAIAAKV